MLHKTKHSLYIIFIVFLWMPLFAMFVPDSVFEKHLPYSVYNKLVAPLKGAVELTKVPVFDGYNWIEGAFQSEFENYLNDNIGGRPFLVRLHNQMKFSLYNEASARGVIRGKDNYLYEHNYIKAYNGEDFIGCAAIDQKAKELKHMQDQLADLGKTFVMCIAPGKAAFYPEYIPDNMRKQPTDSVNYKQYKKALQAYGVNHIDMHAWFNAMKDKDTCGCMLYPKYGIHWSQYGMLLAVDSLTKYIEKERQINMPHIVFKGMQKSTELQYSDYDIAEGMNLLFQMDSKPMCYPHIAFESSDSAVKPATLVVSDSFYWSIFNIGVSTKVFSLGGFWFYNKQIFPDSFESGDVFVKDIDIRQRILSNDIVLLMTTDANLPKFSWGFVEEANRVLKLTDNDIFLQKVEKQKKIDNMIHAIKNTPEWYQSVVEKAKAKGVSVDSMLILDATWMVENEQ